MGFWSDWGGTPHLENLASADEKYRDRLTRWSQTSAFPHWGAGDLEIALAAIGPWYGTRTAKGGTRVNTGSAKNADQYWQHAASWWISPDALYLTISDIQRARIVAAVKQSAKAAHGYTVSRDPVTHLPTKGDLWSQVPWWAWGVAGLVAWNTIKK
ncbi:MAG: hypothetical protein JKX86_08130 [Verrucomicrobiales bacterium]|nr:hypothetical protein [Verrucomicrobiales bacterium]